MEKVYSNKVLYNTISFIDRRFGKETSDRILEELGVDRLAMHDVHGAQTLEFRIRMMEVCHKHTGEEDLGYKVGRNLHDTLGRPGGILFAGLVTSPQRVYERMGVIEPRIAFKTIITTTRLGRNRFRLKVTFRDGFVEHSSACRNRTGSYEAVPRFFGLPFAKVNHDKCAFRGDPACEYDVTLPEYRFFLLLRFSLGAALLSGLSAAVGLAAGNLGWLWAAAGLGGLGLGLFGLFKREQIRTLLEWSELADEEVALKTRSLERHQGPFRALHTFSLGLSQNTSTAGLCDYAAQSLAKDFAYGAAQIWLTDPTRKRISCYCAAGYSTDLSEHLRSIAFRIDEGADNPHGLLVQALHQERILVINDVPEALARLSPASRAFLEKLQLSSFAIAPLFHGREPLGLVAAEHRDGKRLDNQDRLLLAAITRVFADALAQAALYEELERRIALKTREVRDTQEKLLLARRISIQTQKLSGLGQLAAGVAHEINNPLNFLQNIVPEISGDYSALEGIYARLRPHLSQVPGEIADRIATLVDKAELDMHLIEKEYVFSHMASALEKSRRVAASLKVFARSTAKAAVGPEFLLSLVEEAVQLVPQKNRGDTFFQVRIPENLRVLVNRIELVQVLVTLIQNAIEAMERGGTLRIDGLRQGSRIRLRLADSGPGVPIRNHDKIFTPFFSTKPERMGLGLTVAREILQKYQCTIELAESKPGEGAVFVINFPHDPALTERRT